MQITAICRFPDFQSRAGVLSPLMVSAGCQTFDKLTNYHFIFSYEKRKFYILSSTLLSKRINCHPRLCIYNRFSNRLSYQHPINMKVSHNTRCAEGFSLHPSKITHSAVSLPQFPCAKPQFLVFAPWGAQKSPPPWHHQAPSASSLTAPGRAHSSSPMNPYSSFQEVSPIQPSSSFSSLG